jgi:hypothetical protein
MIGSRLAALLGLPMIRSWRGRQLRRLQPFANGRQRGRPVVRYYWERFLEANRADIRGRCLEIGSTVSVRRHGGTAVTLADALDVTRHNEEITVIADLSRADQVPGSTYDCFVIPFTTHLIYDVEAALYHSLRLLKPGGVLLANFPSVDYYFGHGLDMGTGRPLFVFWWFTPIHVENLLRRVGLTGGDYRLTIDGNLLTRVAYQMNMPSEELSRRELDHVDEGHPLLISVRAVRPADWQASRPPYRDPWIPSVEPAPWNPRTGHYPGR